MDGALLMGALTCEHLHLGVEGPDHEVGIFGLAVWCDDCGADALEFHEEYDDEEGYTPPRLVVDRWEVLDV